jgi:hypothetical protein
MDGSAEVSVAELRAAAERLFAAAERRFGSQIRVGGDHYWSIWPTEAFNPKAEAPVLVGDLSDDLAEVRELLERKDPAEDDDLLWHDLHHFIGVLTRLADLPGA